MGGVAFCFEVFTPRGSHVNENEKKKKRKKKRKNRQNSKIQNFEIRKNGLEMWRTVTFPQNLALTRLMVSEKTPFTDGRTVARATALVLLRQSSRAKNADFNTMSSL